MTVSNQEKIEDYRKRRTDILRILDEIVEIIKFQDRPEDTIIEQKLRFDMRKTHAPFWLGNVPKDFKLIRIIDPRITFQ